MTAMESSGYLDCAATTPVDARVLEVMLPFMSERFGNPNSLYGLGRDAYRALEAARESFAAGIGAQPAEIVFMGAGTESDNAALVGISETLAERKKRRHVVVSAFEHHAVLHPAQQHLAKSGFDVTVLKPRADGLVHASDLRGVLRDDTALVSVMTANNEIGTIQPIAELAAAAHEAGALFHTDAVQALGKIPFDVDALGVDAASFSAHKIYGPKGVGALYLRKGTPFKATLLGGGQEMKRRSGTQNVAGATAFAKALELMLGEQAEEATRLGEMRDRIVESVLKLPNTRLNGSGPKLPGYANLIINGCEGESMLLQLDNKGIAVSTGSACSSGSLEPSHVLLAIDCPVEEAHGSLRVSLGRFTTNEDVDRFIEVLPPIVERLRSMNPLYERMYGAAK
jgi:cysteine desulfurase